jgi:metal-responsive CopG/Arc/MetJ family transcriptional regulator
MPSKKPFLSFVIDEELLKKIDDFKFANRFESRAEAIRYLIEKGLSDNVTAESRTPFETQKKSLPADQAEAASA